LYVLFLKGGVVSLLQNFEVAAKLQLQQLNETTGETVYLGVLDGHRVSYVSKMESKWAVRMYSRVGATAPLYCTGTGKALLPCVNEKQLEHYMASVDLSKYTHTTITSKD
jgi:IclR family acetate operon transcriptional repressor